MPRNKTRTVKIGKTAIGGENPILIQSMTNSRTSDFEKTMAQILSLKKAGCSIVRFTVPDMDSVRNIYRFKCSGVLDDVALVADIHFDYRLAIESAMAGIDKIRINPGNIGSRQNIRQVAKVCRQYEIPIRIGVNGGSLDKALLEQYGSPTPEALVASALNEIRLLEECDFSDIVISVKASGVPDMIRANRMIAAACSYPIHLGVTEAGTLRAGLIKSSIGIGSLLYDGIGDTLRVSLTANIEEEAYAAKKILSSLGLYPHGMVDITSCPTCGRTNIDLIKITDELEARLASLTIQKNIRVAVMGCAVNGPGEAREADIGIAGGIKEALLFKKGVPLYKIPEEKIVDTLIDEIQKLKE